jgi:DMSO reductase anchor subunit|tara:strand:- start:955 stop:1224 length:270 start_codon:yes stop_codon:yes gene_type:complete
MQKGISADSQIHISIAFLIKAMIGISLLIASYYQIQMKFASIDSTLNDLQSKVTVLTASVEGMEQEQIEELEATVQEQKSLLQKIGLKK